MIDSLKTNGPSAADVAKVKEQLTRAREVELKQNAYWVGNIMARRQAGEDVAGLLGPYDADGGTGSRRADSGGGEEVLRHEQLRAVRAAAGEREGESMTSAGARPRSSALAAMPAAAQISQREFAARREALAKRIDSGVRDRVRRANADHGLRSVSSAAGLSLSHELRRARRGDRDGRAPRRRDDDAVSHARRIRAPRSTTVGGPTRRRSRRRSACGRGRSRRSEPSRIRWPPTGLPLYTLDDFEDADFSRADSLTRGRVFTRSLVAKHPGLAAKDAAPFVDQLRAKKSAAEIALLRKAAEISSEGHRAAMTAPGALARIRASSRARVHVHSARRVASGVRLDRRLGAERNAAALHEGPRRDEAGRRGRDRRGDRVRRLRGGHHADDSGERHVSRRSSARSISSCATRRQPPSETRSPGSRRRRRRTRRSPFALAGSRSSGWSRAKTRRSIRPGRRTASARRRRASRECCG